MSRMSSRVFREFASPRTEIGIEVIPRLRLSSHIKYPTIVPQSLDVNMKYAPGDDVKDDRDTEEVYHGRIGMLARMLAISFPEKEMDPHIGKTS